MRPAITRWMGASLVGCLLVMGCNQAQRQPVRSTYYYPVRPANYAPATTATASAAPVAESLPDAAPATVVERMPDVLPASASTPVVKVDKEGEPTSFSTASKDRRSFADVTARQGFAHAPDYSWVKGELRYEYGRKMWQVRYASIDEDDQYGGHVLLVDAGRQMGRFSDGQMVTVQGEVVDGDGKDGTRYRMRNIESLSNP